MSLRAWLSVVTAMLVALIIYLARDELIRAWQLLGQVNIWILLLMIPVQALGYIANGEIIFSYLRSKNSLHNLNVLQLARMSLELNFVNHTLPSGGVSGISYMGWRLGKYGIPPSRSTMAQIVAYAMQSAAFVALMLLAVLVVTIDGNLSRVMILISSTLASGTVAVILAGAYLMRSERRLMGFAGWLTDIVNLIVQKITLGHKENILKKDKLVQFFREMHYDFITIRRDKKSLAGPFAWGIVTNVVNIGLFLVTFWALGHPVNPAPVLIAYGVASISGFFVATPGGAGAYEALMIAILSIAGIDSGVVIAGTVLTRVLLLLGTIGFGYLFYQQALVRYGRK